MKRIHNILYNLLLIAGLSSCVTDNALDDCPNQGGNETATAQVVLSLSIPDGQLPPTRVVSESEVNSLWVLEFENDILKEKIDITAKYNNANGKRLYIAIEETEHPVILSIVANQNVSSLDIGTEKEVALQKLTFDNAQTLKYVPMYGETVEFENINRDNSYDTSVELVRALTKIEIQYSSTQTEEEFTFLGIKVLNTNAKGYVKSLGIPTQTSVKSVAADPVSINSKLKTASVYIAETNNNESNKIQILVHGRYKGTDCWYRLDMIKENEKDEITILKRNYKYVFALQNVNFLGRTESDVMEGDPDNKAFDARLMTLNAEEADILDITTDDEYFLGVNSSTLQSTVNDGGLCFAKLKILTNNVFQGWAIVDAPEGVTFNPGTTGGLANSDEQRKVETVWIFIVKTKVTKDFDFYVTTGKIRKVITVSFSK